jgi:hypothetical protein
MNQEPRKVITIPAKPELAQAKTARRQLRVAAAALDAGCISLTHAGQ